MKKETSIIVASSIGFLAVLGILGFRRILKLKNQKSNYFSDYQKRFERYGKEDHHGVEFLSML